MSKQDQIWGGKWKRLGHLGKGGQGLTYMIQNIETDNDQFVLKILKDQKSANKRARMYREVAAYRTLNYQGIPKLIDSNAELFEGIDPLFLITDYIPGPTLEEYIKHEGSQKLNSALVILNNLIGIIQHCHDRNIIHRDIKPDNIILKDEDIKQLYLIDFGLSFNQEDELRVTPSNEQLTNRFLHLPELNSQLSKIDIRTDITYCVGILFYILTSEYPQDLTDHDNKMPHQRGFADAIISKLPNQQARILKTIFDRGFATHIDYRYQSIDALKADLIILINSKEENKNDPIANLQKFKEEVKRISAGDKRYSARKIFSDVDKVLTRTVHILAQEFSDPFGTIQTGVSYDYKGYVYKNKYGIQSSLDPDKAIWPELSATITGSELVLLLKEGNDEETLRLPTNDINWDQVTQFIRNYFLYRTEKLL